MNIPNTFKKALIGAAVAALVSAPAFAGQVSYDLLTPFVPVTNPATPFPGTLPSFDPALGTLTGVSFSYAPESKVEYTITHKEGESGFVRWQNIGATSQITFGGQVILLADLFGTQSFAWPDQGGGKCDVAGVCTISANFITSQLVVDIVDPVNFSIFDGPGPVDFVIDNLQVNNGFSSSGATSVAVTAYFVESFGTLTYTYVPEPGSLALLALGGLAAGFIRRQRKA